MKKLYFLLIIAFVSSAKAQIVNIPDANFKAYLLNANPSNERASTEATVYIYQYNFYNNPTSFSTIDTNNDNEIQVSEAQQIKYLKIGNSTISNLSGIEAFSNLHTLYCNNLPLINSLDVSSFVNLESLTFNEGNITNLNISGLTNLKLLDCSNNQLTNLDVSDNTNLYNLNCSENQLTNLDVSQNINLQCLNFNINQIANINVSGLLNLKELGCAGNLLTILNISGLLNLEGLGCSGNNLINLDVSGFVNLKSLTCGGNQLTTLNLTGLNNVLEFLDVYNNQLTSIDIVGFTKLFYFRCSNNQLTSLDLSGCIMLRNHDGIINLQGDFTFGNNPISSLNLSGCTSLTSLEIGYIYNSNLPNLSHINIEESGISFITISNLPSLETIIFNNVLTEVYIGGGPLLKNIDVSNNPNLTHFSCYGSMEYLNIKGTNFYDPYYVSISSSLKYICADEEDIPLIQLLINEADINATCHVNTYCSFTPGGTFYTINGNNRFDGNNNGCESSDVGYPYLKFEVTDGTNNGNFIANETGAYFYDVHPANHTLTPVLQNPSYFFISPTTITVDFPSQASPFVQDFCITPNGVHHDLEVTIIPLGVARPGFDASYKIVYKNNGNQLEDATVTFAFDDTIMDFLTASTNITNQSLGLLSWNVGMITPFLSGSIIVSFNLNSPMETPAVNAGDILSFTATINGLFTDETPIDNIFTLNQTVVNSYDPNDKTCLEGETIDPSMIGKYVHYQIRFENTGTFPAQNVVVKDMIDATKFDVSSLQMVNSSHSCYTRITGNKVEFIFENINLPFEDATNDGYIVFKIKTLPTLTINSTISNTAEIYFDYNFPIITNTATSTYQTLANPSFDFENEFTLYPNPAKNTLHISAKNNLEISSIEIYNLVGQLVIVKPNFSDTIDVSNLASGTYFIKVNTEKGSGTSKFVKE